jgi:transcriptional regulator with XRE-family HTH domain
VLPDIEEVAAIMATEVATWQRWERSQDRPAVNVMIEFAHRFGVSLDFLYRGQLTGMAPEVWAAILALHPELAEPEQQPDPISESTARPGIRKARGDDRPVPRASVAASKTEKG